MGELFEFVFMITINLVMFFVVCFIMDPFNIFCMINPVFFDCILTVDPGFCKEQEVYRLFFLCLSDEVE